MMFKDYYAILKVGRLDGDIEIAAALRNALTSVNKSELNKNTQFALLSDIYEAYYVLRNPSLRVLYDKEYTVFMNLRRENACQAVNTPYQATSSWTYNYEASSIKKELEQAEIVAKFCAEELCQKRVTIPLGRGRMLKLKRHFGGTLQILGKILLVLPLISIVVFIVEAIDCGGCWFFDSTIAPGLYLSTLLVVGTYLITHNNNSKQ